MHLAETGQPIPQEAMAPHSPPEVENRTLELPETRKQVDLGTYNPKPEALVNNWELLGHLPTPPTEDFKIDFIRSLSETDKAITAKAKEAIKKRDNPDNPDDTDFKKISNIFTLRKLMLGHDWRAENVAAQARIHIIQKRRKIAQEAIRLNKIQMRSELLDNTVASLREKFKQLTADQNKLDELIQAGYPKLWEKVRPEIETATGAPTTSDNEDASIDEEILPTEDVPPAEAGATITTEDEPAAEGEQKETEVKKLLILKAAIERILPEEYKKLAPEITKALSERGFSFIQRDNSVIKNGRAQETTRYSLFIDPSRQDLPEKIAELQSAAYEEIGKYFEKKAERIKQAIDAPAPVKEALLGLFSKGKWDYADMQDADVILEQLHEQNPDKAYVMYMKAAPTGEKLARINAGADAEVSYKENTDDKKAPSYKDGGVTQFFSSPTFSFDINK